MSGNPADWTSLPATSCPGTASQRGTYDFLTTLPTNPTRLRAWIFAHPDGDLKPDVQARVVSSLPDIPPSRVDTSDGGVSC